MTDDYEKQLLEQDIRWLVSENRRRQAIMRFNTLDGTSEMVVSWPAEPPKLACHHPDRHASDCECATL